MKISKRQAFLISTTIWCFCISLALIPLYIFDDFYSNSGICTALPLRSYITSSWIYSFSIFVCFNFLTFLFIALAQWPIFLKVKETVRKVRSTAENVELEVAKKLTMVVITDCLCWLPIGIMGMLAIGGIYLPRSIYAFVVVFVMPVNAALNPIIYTFPQLITLKAMKKCTKSLNLVIRRSARTLEFILTRDYCTTFVILMCFMSVVLIIVLLIYNFVYLSDIVKDLSMYEDMKQGKQLMYHQLRMSILKMSSFLNNSEN